MKSNNIPTETTPVKKRTQKRRLLKSFSNPYCIWGLIAGHWCQMTFYNGIDHFLKGGKIKFAPK